MEEGVFLLGIFYKKDAIHAMLRYVAPRGWSSVSSCLGFGLLVCLYVVMLPCLCQLLCDAEGTRESTFSNAHRHGT